jgi:hypothetical protein
MIQTSYLTPKDIFSLIRFKTCSLSFSKVQSLTKDAGPAYPAGTVDTSRNDIYDGRKEKL